MTIHITDIPNESFNHYKHVLHVDNEFALIEINKDNYLGFIKIQLSLQSRSIHIMYCPERLG